MRPPPLTCARACCGGVVQLTVKLVLAVPPAGTLTFTGFVLVTVQLLATVSVSLRLPAGRPLNVTLPFGTIGWLVALGVPASTVTVKVLGKLEPVVVFDTVRLPVVGGVVQFTVKLVLAVPPAGTLTFTGFVLVTVQLSATASVTL